jgi:hypothetical protein
MVGEKIVSISFDGAARHGEWAPGAGATHARTAGASVDRPLRGADRRHVTQGLDTAMPKPKLGLDTSTPNLGHTATPTPILGLDASMPTAELGVDVSSPIPKLGVNASTPNPMVGVDPNASTRPTWGTQPRLHPSWVWRHMCPPTCVNIIMCVINIIFSLIIQSIHIKNSIFCVMNIIIFIITQSIDIKNIIMCCNHP